MIKRRAYIGLYLLSIFCLLFANCSKSVYVQTDELGTSKYVIYKDNYNYIEKTKHTEFEVWGKYYLTDSTIVFVLGDKEPIPYNYLGKNIKKSSKNVKSAFTHITLIDKHTKEPIPFASIGAKNKLNQYVGGTDTDIKGIAELRKNDEIELLEIMFIGYAKQVIDYKSHKDYDLVIEMEELKSGGKLSEGCLVTFLDVFLDYKIQKKSNFDEFERNGIVFKKEVNRP